MLVSFVQLLLTYKVVYFDLMRQKLCGGLLCF